MTLIAWRAHAAAAAFSTEACLLSNTSSETSATSSLLMSNTSGARSIQSVCLALTRINLDLEWMRCHMYTPPLMRISGPRDAHQREGNEKFTLEAIIAEEEHILKLADQSDNRSRLDLRAEDLGDLSADQKRVIRNIAVSPFLVQPLQAPAGAGKTHSLKALRAAAHRARKDVLVLAPRCGPLDGHRRGGGHRAAAGSHGRPR
jgi:hypothetical protein